jgi:hypothetical protein
MMQQKQLPCFMLDHNESDTGANTLDYYSTGLDLAQGTGFKNYSRCRKMIMTKIHLENLAF